MRNCNSPYGMSKAFTKRILKDCILANPKLNVTIFRYFNPFGTHPSGLISENFYAKLELVTYNLGTGIGYSVFEVMSY